MALPSRNIRVFDGGRSVWAVGDIVSFLRASGSSYGADSVIQAAAAGPNNSCRQQKAGKFDHCTAGNPQIFAAASCGAKKGPPEAGLQRGRYLQETQSGGLGVDLGEIVLRGLRAVSDELA